MPDPVLHLIVGSNGAGKSTLHERVIGPVTHLEFVNADVIAAERWPHDTADRSYDAAAIATRRQTELLAARTSFISETVFSHRSKVDLLRSAVSAGYLVTLHIVMVPEALAVARVVNRVQSGGHPVPEEKVRQRYRRLWPLIATAVPLVDTAIAYDNSRADHPFRTVATFAHGAPVGPPTWPPWTPEAMRRVPSVLVPEIVVPSGNSAASSASRHAHEASAAPRDTAPIHWPAARSVRDPPITTRRS